MALPELARRLADAIGRGAPDPEFLNMLRVALTHSSHAHEQDNAIEHNERLEFLGDAVLDLCVAELLWHSYPDMPPGDLTRVRAAVVSGDALAEVARGWGVGAALRLGRGEEQGGGRERASNLSRAWEAIVAAVYSCEGYGAALALTRATLGGPIRAAVARLGLLDAKSALQEYAQANGLSPAYETIRREGPQHAPVWHVVVRLAGLSATAAAGSQRQAEKEAAAALLAQLGDAEVQ